jgi:hypothetical protein
MPYMEIVGPGAPECKGDNHSDLSEESLTGDSGRGGSEEDVRNSGLPHSDSTGKFTISHNDSTDLYVYSGIPHNMFTAPHNDSMS